MREKIFFFALVLQLITFLDTVKSQDASLIPGLLNELNNAKSDSVRVEIYRKLSFNYSTSNPDRGIYYGKQGLVVALKIKYKKGIGDCYNSIGWCYCRKGDYKEAKENLVLAVNTFKEIGNNCYLNIPYGNLGSMYYTMGNYAESLHYTLLSVKLNEGCPDEGFSSVKIYSIGIIYNAQKDFKKAIGYFNEALAIDLKNKNLPKAALNYNGLGNAYLGLKDYTKAISYFMMAKKLYEQYNNLNGLGFIHESLGSVFLEQKKYHDALKNYHIAKDYFIKINSTTDIIYETTLIADALKQKGDYDNAIINLEQAIQLAKSEEGNINYEIEAQQSLSELYSLKSDYKSAYIHFKETIKLKDSVNVEKQKTKLAELQTKFETEKKEKEIELLNKDKILEKQETEKQKQLKNFLIVLIVVLLLFGFQLFRSFKKEKTHSKQVDLLNEELKKQRDEISNINRMLQLKALRTQMNPHFVFNCMNSIQECILNNDSNKASNYLSKFSRLLRMILESADAELLPLAKEAEMLSLYLSLEANRLLGSFQYTLYISDLLDEEEIVIPPLLLQPIVENAIWHGLASKTGERKLDIRIEPVGDFILCTIEDNGIGRAAAHLYQNRKPKYVSRGMDIVTERILLMSKNELKGVISIEDLKDNNDHAAGTRVTIRIPFLN